MDCTSFSRFQFKRAPQRLWLKWRDSIIPSSYIDAYTSDIIHGEGHEVNVIKYIWFIDDAQ